MKLTSIIQIFWPFGRGVELPELLVSVVAGGIYVPAAVASQSHHSWIPAGQACILLPDAAQPYCACPAVSQSHTPSAEAGQYV